MIEILKAVDNNNKEWEAGDGIPYSRDARIGKAVSDYLWGNLDQDYVMQKLAAVSVMSGCNISTSSLYRARRYWLEQLKPRRAKKGPRR